MKELFSPIFHGVYTYTRQFPRYSLGQGFSNFFLLATLTIAFKNLATLLDAKIPLFLACFVKNFQKILLF
jgi:hypothetical protein